MKDSEASVDRRLYPLRIAASPGDSPMFLSELKVCRSGAGYYIGRMCWNIELEFEEPGTRESSCYFKTKEIAQYALDNKSFEIRDCSENEMLYEAGCPLPYVNER